MHSSSIRNLERFFKVYFEKFDNPKILDLGGTKHSKINASDILKKLRHKFEYTTVDIETHESVDIVLKDPYVFDELKNNQYDIVISISCFEHIEFFWKTYLEILKILKPNGIFYLNVPSNGIFHRWHKDCWRFYPDSASALINWGKVNNYHNFLLESFTTKKFLEGGWNDYNAIILKDKKYKDNFHNRIIDQINDFYNGIKNDDYKNLINSNHITEDQNNIGYKFWYTINKKLQKIFQKKDKIK